MDFGRILRINYKPEDPSAPPPTTKPKDSALKQQKLNAWQPILTAGTVLPFFFVIGILFIPVGIGLLFFSNNVRETTVPYTYCTSDANENLTCAEFLRQNAKKIYGACNCTVNFNLTNDFNGKVYMYYALTNFYQNHRRYVKSRDDIQMLGNVMSNGNPVSPARECAPFDKVGDKYYYPCGAIANSMFNDEIKLYKNGDQNVSLLNTGIAWDSDKLYKFRNPANISKRSQIWKNFTRPRDWIKNVWELDPDNDENNGVQNEDFIVWMRIAALPNFRKLYRIINHNATEFRSGLPAGNYTLKIVYNYNVTSFHGTKSVILSTTSLLGGKNPFLGVSYIVVGTICLVLAIGLLFTHIKYGKSRSETINITSGNDFRS